MLKEPPLASSARTRSTFGIIPTTSRPPRRRLSSSRLEHQAHSRFVDNHQPEGPCRALDLRAVAVTVAQLHPALADAATLIAFSELMANAWKFAPATSTAS
jgi:hypothetical protein